MNNLLVIGLICCIATTVTGCDYKDNGGVDCKNRNLSSIPPNTFEADIESLDLSHNGLEELEWNDFQDYPDLKSLYLNQNEIYIVEKRAFSDLTSLQFLDLSNNQIVLLRSDTFSSNVQLKTLSLRNNPLQMSIDDPSAFLLSESLKVLDLSHCTLTSIDSRTFQGFPALERLDMRSNLLTSLPLDMLDGLDNIGAVYLAGNPWKCGQELETFLEKFKPIVKDYLLMMCWDENDIPHSAEMMETSRRQSTTSSRVSSGSTGTTDQAKTVNKGRLLPGTQDRIKESPASIEEPVESGGDYYVSYVSLVGTLCLVMTIVPMIVMFIMFITKSGLFSKTDIPYGKVSPSDVQLCLTEEAMCQMR